MRFYMLDRITEWNVGQSAKGIKNVSMSEDFFTDHFPRYPIMPGVLVIEAMAQLSGVLLQATVKRDYDRNVKAILTMLEKVKFRNAARPGDSLLLDSKIISVNDDSGRIISTATVDEKLIAEAEMMFVWFALEDAQLLEEEQRLLQFWLQDIQ
ncbi:MAG: hypothetical protein A2Y62_05945 [Candidatus Fischerbacteria bacterium RBG_13_37_8]|uniref:3-hydroxyacyl-[acyl-carrier-protein] dehydratase FabZ n=1 Tax=Candidatus Fischerbacteria bacterium RBG_13_37_8 TaxID=1817863 RepID=A0A1F5V7L8_9BACT|nr:MAG: hypothetical protein A2Y62_05945 [Candidatus Fischerbacteria bacterium RBG_13_37_8]